MSRIPPRLARRIDRLSRAAHSFHRFAHHPLCDHYRNELVGLGRRRRICRGCLAVALGALIGAVAGLVCPVEEARRGILLLAIASLVGLLSLKIHRPKLLTRFTPALLASAAITGAARAACTGDVHAILVLAAGGLLGLGGLLVYRKRGPNRAPCVNCPERSNAVACSGVAPILRRERAFQRLAQRWLDTAPK